MIDRLDAFDFHHRLERTPGTSLVYFTASGCGACKALRRALERLCDLRPDLSLFEVDAQRDTALVREFEVFHLPSLFLYRDGLYHAPLHCAPSPEAVLEALEQALTQPAEDAP